MDGMDGFLLITTLIILFFLYKKYQSVNYASQNESSKIEPFIGTSRMETELDKKRAVKYAMKKMCEKQGYQWIQGGDEFVYDCKHTRDTCLRESVFPTKKDADPKYYEWRPTSSPDAKELGIEAEKYGMGSTISGATNLSKEEVNAVEAGGVCIIGNEPFRQFCEDEFLQYDPSNGKCVTTAEYCNPRMLAFCNGDCLETPSSKVLSSVFGTTIGRSLPTLLPFILPVAPWAGVLFADYFIAQAACGKGKLALGAGYYLNPDFTITYAMSDIDQEYQIKKKREREKTA